MKTISLHQFRESVASLDEPVQVQRRDGQGNYQVLGTWTPSSGGLSPAAFLTERSMEMMEAQKKTATFGPIDVPAGLETETFSSTWKPPRAKTRGVPPQTFDHLSAEERKVVGDPKDYDWSRPVREFNPVPKPGKK